VSASRWRAPVREQVQRRAEDIVGFAQELVRVPSETHPPGGDEGPVQRVVAAKLEQLGLLVDVFEPWSVEDVEQHDGWWPGLDYRDRPNVVATWEGRGGGQTLILNGHVDVVPAGPPERWATDPYGAELRDAAIWGRGAVDMKGGVAAMIMAVEILRECGYEPAGSVIVESVVNEELGGYNGTLACCVKGYAGDAAIVLEPTGLDIAPASKGGQVYRAIVRGQPAHSALWKRGTSALDKALILKDALVGWERIRASECADAPFFGAGSECPAFADTVWSLRAGDPDVMAHPETAELLFWVDLLPGESRDEVLARFERFVQSHTATDPFLREHPAELSRATMRPFLGHAIDREHPIVTTLAGAAQEAGVPSKLVGEPGACDAMIFNVYSKTPAVVFGPGDLALAHAPDEHLPVGELLKAVEILALTIADFCGGSRTSRAERAATR
jgi:acetylornithine deacetylase